MSKQNEATPVGLLVATGQNWESLQHVNTNRGNLHKNMQRTWRKGHWRMGILCRISWSHNIQAVSPGKWFMGRKSLLDCHFVYHILMILFYWLYWLIDWLIYLESQTVITQNKYDAMSEGDPGITHKSHGLISRAVPGGWRKHDGVIS